jgi:signal transduction histidine kinase
VSTVVAGVAGEAAVGGWTTTSVPGPRAGGQDPRPPSGRGTSLHSGPQPPAGAIVDRAGEAETPPDLGGGADGASESRDVELVDEVLRWTQHAGFLAVAGWALMRWARHRDAQHGWLAVTFGAIGVTVLADLAGELLGQDPLPPWVTRPAVAVLVLFPALLLRFLDTFERVAPSVRRTVDVAVLATAVGLLVLPLPRPGDPMTGGVLALTVLVVATWLSVLPYVGARFWRAGAGRPTLARRRLRLLGSALVALAVALLLAAAIGDEVGAGSVVTQVVALGAALAFVVAFVTPPALRRRWRQPEERRLHEAAVDLLRADTVEDVAATVLPHLRRSVGARAVALDLHDERVRLDGHLPPEGGPTIRATLEDGLISVWTDRYAPFFGTEEHDLVDRAALLADLALQRVRLLAREQQARRALEGTNAELESFVYSASHDLKSPLIAMLSYVDLLRADHGERLGDEGGWYLERLATNGRYMEALIRDLLELSRVGRVRTEPDDVDLEALTAGVADELRRRYPAVTVVLGPLPVLRMNPARARQLVTNLLENAVHHGGDAVHVTVGARSAREGEVELTVVDDGPGVPEAYRERVFGVFERLEADGTAGTGIGLAICRKIVESVGGRIWLADRDDGAEFRVRLPADVVVAPPRRTLEVPV